MRSESDTYRYRCLCKPLSVTRPWPSHRLCKRTQPGQAEDCVAANKGPCTHEVPGCFLFDTDQGLDSNACDAVKALMAVACEGSDGVGVANIGEPSDSTQKMLGLRCRYLLPSDSQRSQPPSRVPQFVIPGALLFGVYPG